MRLDDIDRVDGLSTPMRRRRTYAVVSTFPPTPCGVATFSAALCDGLAHAGRRRHGRSGRRRERRTRRAGGGHALRPQLDARSGGVDALAQADVVIVQHEYGLYAGKDGDSVIDVLEALEAPSIVVAHTVLRSPTPHQRAVLEAVVDAADAVVVMTEAGRAPPRRRLRRRPGEGRRDPARRRRHRATPTSGTSRRVATLLTWGLLGPGKGIEWAIDALALLDDLRPRATYRIAGDTHPKVAAAKGEAYRDMLRRRAADAGLGRITCPSTPATAASTRSPTSSLRRRSSCCPTTHPTR